MSGISFEREEDVLYYKNGVQITKFLYPNMMFCSFIEYEDNDMCYSIELTNLAFQMNIGAKEFNTTTLGEIKDEDIVAHILKNHHIYLERYNIGKKEDCPATAFVFSQKRDYAKQYFKAYCSGAFSKKALYDYGKNLYSNSEDGYGYEVLGGFLQVLRNDLNDCISDEIKNILKDKVDKDGYVIIYRGFNSKSRLDGISFTLSKKVATFFAKRWSGTYSNESYINKYKVKVDDIVAYISSEEEVLTTKAILLEEDI